VGGEKQICLWTKAVEILNTSLQAGNQKRKRLSGNASDESNVMRRTVKAKIFFDI